jgi:secernin
MCDTFTFFSRMEPGRSFFAKNSDRDPGETQIIEMVYNARKDFETDFLSEKLTKYTKSSFRKLEEIFPKFEHPYAALISRPVWIWGAEMGINEKGVAIGNEAVFSKQKLRADGLLGMDILRLALHNAANADEAVDFIINLLEKYGQGGNGSYKGTLKYHNSFLIKDSRKAMILESSAGNWIVKDVNESASISNCYSPGQDYVRTSESLSGKNVAKTLENRLITFFAQGRLRQQFTASAIENRDKNLLQVFDLLRSHIRPDNNPHGGMKSVCVHPGILIKSETVSSMVVDYYNKSLQIIWHTSSPNPCVSIYKPVVMDVEGSFPLFSDLDDSEAYFCENRKLSAYFLKNYTFFVEKIKALRDETEQKFQDIIYHNIEDKSKQELVNDCHKCYQLEQEYLLKVKQEIEKKDS